jgi:hypothetical protein
MKKILIILFLIVVHCSFAQKLEGIYNANQGMGIFTFTPSSNLMEVSKPLPASIGPPDAFWPSICQYNGKIYGRTPINNDGNNGSIYEYNLTTKAFTLLYAFKLEPENYSRYEVVVSKTGLLYGIASDSIVGAYVFELDPNTKVLKEYFTDKNTDIINAHYVTIAENNKMYFVIAGKDAENNSISKIIEFDLSSKLFVEKLATKDIPCMSHTASDVIAEIGDGKLAGTVNRMGFGPSVFLYDYINNKVIWHRLDDYKQVYEKSGGPAVRYGADLYIMTSSGKRNGFGSVLKINIATGQYEEVANLSKLGAYYPATGCVLNDVLYGYEAGNKIISYDFKTKKTSIIRFLKEDGFTAQAGFILVK